MVLALDVEWLGVGLDGVHFLPVVAVVLGSKWIGFLPAPGIYGGFVVRTIAQPNCPYSAFWRLGVNIPTLPVGLEFGSSFSLGVDRGGSRDNLRNLR